MRAALRRLAEPVTGICGTCNKPKDATNGMLCYKEFTPCQLQSAAKHGCRPCDFRHRIVQCLRLDPQKLVNFHWSEISVDDQTFQIFRIPGG